jgi:hypothetical protein
MSHEGQHHIVRILLLVVLGRFTVRQNAGWKPMLHWVSGVLSDLSNPSEELSPWTRRDDAAA